MSAVIDRLDRVKQTRPGSYVAGCPCCKSKRGRPISVRELDDGRVLVHPFCGCDTGEVLAEVGLQMSDLFPERLPGHSYQPVKSRIPARDLLEVIDHEVMVASLILADALQAREVDGAQWDRLAQAAERIGRAHDHARG